MSTELTATGSNDPVDDRVERLVWKYLGVKSARQIADIAGVTPDVVLRVKRELLDSVDVLSIQEKRQKLLVDLQAMAQKAQDDYDSSPWEFKSGLLNSATASIKAVLVELNRADKADQSKVEALNALRVRELLTLLDEVVTGGVSEIAERYGLDEDDLFEVFQRNLTEAAAKRDAQ